MLNRSIVRPMKVGRYGKSPFNHSGRAGQESRGPDPHAERREDQRPYAAHKKPATPRSILHQPRVLSSNLSVVLAWKELPRTDTCTSPPCSALNLRSPSLFQAFENRTVIRRLTCPAGPNQALKRSGPRPVSPALWPLCISIFLWPSAAHRHIAPASLRAGSATRRSPAA